MEKSTRQGVQAERDRNQHGVLLYLLATVALIAFFMVKRIPEARQQALLALGFEKAGYLASNGVLLAAAVSGLAAREVLRARSRDYTPPSVRVQVYRSLAYGSGLCLAALLGTAGLRPEVVFRVLELRAQAILLLVPIAPFSVSAWYLCFRKREFQVPELRPFRDVAAALAESNDFILGRAGTDWKTGGGDPFWFVVPEAGMFANLYCLGGIGSGKTSAVAKPILEQALFKFPNHEKKKVGIFLLDAKGNNADHVLRRARAAGREKDVVILKPGGAWSYNPVAWGTPTALANKLVAALETMTEQESNSYYKKMQREFSENAFQILEDSLGKFSMMDLYEFICDSQRREQLLDLAKAKNSISYRWFLNQWAKEDPREQMMLTKGFRADLSSFVRDDIAPTFAVANATFPGWEQLIDEGKIVVFSMSLDEYGDFARAMGIFVLMDFQNVMLARTTTKFRAAGHNSERLICCFIDEVWAYMNPKLAEFTSVSREARCCTIALHQSLAQIPEKYRQVVLGNFRTPLLLSVNDMLTLTEFSKLFGTHKVWRESRSESSGFAGVEVKLLSDNYRAREGGESKSHSVSQTLVDEPRFTTDELLHLKFAHAVIQMFDGRDTRTPQVIRTLPDYEDGNLLGEPASERSGTAVSP